MKNKRIPYKPAESLQEIIAEFLRWERETETETETQQARETAYQLRTINGSRRLPPAQPETETLGLLWEAQARTEPYQY